MKNIAILLILLSSNAVAEAADSTYGNIRFAPGTTLTANVITLVADANGVLQIDRTKLVSIGPIEIEIPTTPPPIPPKDPLTQKVNEIIDLAPKVANERAAVSKLYERIAEFPTEEADELRRGVEFLFNLLSLPKSWDLWKAKVDVLADPLAVDDVRRVWKLIGEGLAQ